LSNLSKNKGNLALPPNVTMFRITEASSKAVRLRWSHRYIKSTDRFQYELEWRNQGIFLTLRNFYFIIELLARKSTNFLLIRIRKKTF
jgi:hypothetical protein